MTHCLLADDVTQAAGSGGVGASAGEHRRGLPHLLRRPPATSRYNGRHRGQQRRRRGDDPPRGVYTTLIPPSSCSSSAPLTESVDFVLLQVQQMQQTVTAIVPVLYNKLSGAIHVAQDAIRRAMGGKPWVFVGDRFVHAEQVAFVSQVRHPKRHQYPQLLANLKQTSRQPKHNHEFFPNPKQNDSFQIQNGRNSSLRRADRTDAPSLTHAPPPAFMAIR